MPTRACSDRVGLQAAHCGDKLKSRTYRPLGVVLVSLGIPKVHENPVAHVLRHKANEALHCLGDAFLIGRNDLAQILSVHPS